MHGCVAEDFVIEGTLLTFVKGPGRRGGVREDKFTVFEWVFLQEVVGGGDHGRGAVEAVYEACWTDAPG